MRTTTFVTAFFFAVTTLAAADLQVPTDPQPVPIPMIQGLYFRYEGAEYESGFSPCSVQGIWRVTGDEPLNELIASYKSSEHSRYGELLVELQGTFIATNRVSFPQEHYAGELKLSRLLSHSSDSQAIEACRNKQKASNR